MFVDQRSDLFTMKKLAFAIAGAVVSVFPLKLRHLLAKTLLDDPTLARDYGYVYLSGLARKFNVVRLSANGQFGTMTSNSNDTSILREYAETGLWAAALLERLKRFFADSGGTYLDIGANIGMTMIPILQLNERVTCHAFEPEPSNYKNLLRNIVENCPSASIMTYQLALHDREETLPFEISEGNLGDHRLHVKTGLRARQDEDQRRIIEVRCVRLDDLNIDLKSPVFVKIDTQGAEPYVVAGGRRTLACADALMVEWSPYHMARLGGDPNIVLEFLDEHFDQGRIEETDARAGEPGQSGPVREITAILRDTISGWRDDPSRYVDVIVTKGS